MDAALKVRKPDGYDDWAYFFGFDLVDRTTDEAVIMLDQPAKVTKRKGEVGHGPVFKVVFNHGKSSQYRGRIHEFSLFLSPGLLETLASSKVASLRVVRIQLMKRTNEGGRARVADILCNTDAFLVSGSGETIDRLA
jgi:hypothetical protein